MLYLGDDITANLSYSVNYVSEILQLPFQIL